MNKKTVIIKTASGGIYGSGHAHRAVTLAAALNACGRYETLITMSSYPDYIPVPMRHLYPDNIPDKTGLIIRDMRDSTTEEMADLRKKAPVIAVDDIGPGRFTADMVIDLLPNPIHESDSSSYYPELFLFGSGFINSINAIELPVLEKTIDIAFYPGLAPDAKYRKDIISIFPGESTAVILQGAETSLIKNGEIYPADISYALALISSKILITHFGISLFEGLICGCAPAVINPSDYHNTLTDIASKNTALLNLGLYKNFDRIKWSHDLKKLLAEKNYIPPDINKIKDEINSFAERFTEKLDTYFDGPAPAQGKKNSA